MVSVFHVKTLCAALFLTEIRGLDTTIAAAVQTTVYERFDNIEDLAWVGLGFPLGSVSAIMFAGRLFDLYDNKWLYNASILTFEVGSALCGGAPTMNALIVGRVIGGLGGLGMYIGFVFVIQSELDPITADRSQGSSYIVRFGFAE